MSSTTEYWDKSHAEFEFKIKQQSAYAEDKEKLFPTNSIVADIGGGQGADAEYFLQHGHPVVLVDASSVALEHAQGRIDKAELGKDFKTVKTIIGEENINLPHNSVDIIYSRLALHFFDAPTTVKVFRDVYRILKDGGTAYISVKSPEEIPENIQEIEYLREHAKEISPGVFTNEQKHIRSRFTKEQWTQILTQAGIPHFEINTYLEDLSDRKDATKSGVRKLLLNEIIIKK